MSTGEKLENLKRILSESESAVVALSGGTDSTFLAYMASRASGLRLLAAIISSPYMFDNEIKDALGFCIENNINYKVIEMSIPATVKNNPPERCYLCKKEIMGLIHKVAENTGSKYVFDGTNADDAGDYRPGMKALSEMGIRSPLLETGLTKDEIRALSKEIGLKTWDKPSNACLMTRFPHNVAITDAELRKVEAAEAALENISIRGARVRVHNDIARIECRMEDIARLTSENARKKVVDELKRIGYRYITLDLEGYRTGNMNVKIE